MRTLFYAFALAIALLGCRAPDVRNRDGTTSGTAAPPARLRSYAAPPGPAQVQSLSVTTAWSGAADAGAAPAGSVLQVDTTTMAAATVVVTNASDGGGAFTGTLVFEGTADGTNWWPVPLAPVSSGSSVSTVTAPGQWQLNVGGAYQFRVRCSALSVGTPLVTISASGFGVGGNTDEVTISGTVTVTDPATVAMLDGGVQTFTPYQSQQWIAWQKQADGGAQALLPVWSKSLAVPANGAVDVAPDAGTGWICIATSACTTSDAGAGPTTADAGVTDGTCTYAGCYASTWCPGGVTVVDTDSVNAALVGNAQVQLIPASPNYGSVNGPLPKDPLTIYTKAMSGTPVLVVGCFQ